MTAPGLSDMVGGESDSELDSETEFGMESDSDPEIDSGSEAGSDSG